MGLSFANHALRSLALIVTLLHATWGCCWHHAHADESIAHEGCGHEESAPASPSHQGDDCGDQRCQVVTHRHDVVHAPAASLRNDTASMVAGIDPVASSMAARTFDRLGSAPFLPGSLRVHDWTGVLQV